jgi:hypothetical protein
MSNEQTPFAVGKTLRGGNKLLSLPFTVLTKLNELIY